MTLKRCLDAHLFDFRICSKNVKNLLIRTILMACRLVAQSGNGVSLF